MLNIHSRFTFTSDKSPLQISSKDRRPATSTDHGSYILYFIAWVSHTDLSPKVQRNNVRDTDLSIRFKLGKNTIFLFVDSMTTLSQVQEELLDTLKERYPDGLKTSTKSSEKTIELPDDASQIKFAILKNKTDPTQGWKPLEFESDDHPVDKGFQDNMVVAFAIAADDADDVDFEVEFPSYEEEEEAEEVGDL
ncbi:hypothetical protein GGR55DRAFT_684255 [Xylaria sp. FL0064]|nr:hypothetical protein GGR55DRAFT_684255 [Xylaria sp. FL0064]